MKLADHQTLRPLSDRLLVQPVENRPDTTLHVPDTAEDPPERGIVHAVGPGRRLDSGRRAPMDVDEGDEVIFGRYAGKQNTVEVDGTECRLVQAREVKAVVER